MEDTHSDFAPETTAHDTFEELKETVEEMDLDLSNAGSHIVTDLKESEHEWQDNLEDFMEDQHTALEPDVTAHEWEEEVFAE